MRVTSRRLVVALVPVAAFVLPACGRDDDPADGDAGDGGELDGGATSPWEIVHENLPGALLSVWGTAADDIWAVGSDPGDGPTVLHYDGAEWQSLDTGTAGDLWWVFGPDGGPVYMGGVGGTILSYQDGTFVAMETPASDVTVFGIWGCSPEDVWAVGGGANGSSGGFAWRLDAGTWVDAEGFPTEIGDADAVWKIFGRRCDDVWMVGTAGLALHWDGAAFGEVERVAGGSLFTVHASADRFVAVGGFGVGIVIENDGSGWVDAAPAAGDPMIGVHVTEEGGTAAGWYGSVLSRAGGQWKGEETGVTVMGNQGFHSVWVDPDGGVWLAGGQVSSPPLGHGLMIHKNSTDP